MNDDWKWNWKICPSIYRLYQRMGEWWTVYQRVKAGHTIIQYSRPVNNHAIPPTKAIPVTVATPQPLQILVKLPLCPVHITLPLDQRAQPYILHHLTCPTTQWEEPLWKQIRPCQDLFRLAHDLTTGVPILLSTDAAMNAAKCSCFAWTIYSIQNYGKGPVQYQEPTKMHTPPDPRHLAYWQCSDSWQIISTDFHLS